MDALRANPKANPNVPANDLVQNRVPDLANDHHQDLDQDLANDHVNDMGEYRVSNQDQDHHQDQDQDLDLANDHLEDYHQDHQQTSSGARVDDLAQGLANARALDLARMPPQMPPQMPPHVQAQLEAHIQAQLAAQQQGQSQHHADGGGQGQGGAQGAPPFPTSGDGPQKQSIPKPGYGADFTVGIRRPILWMAAAVLGLFVLWAANAPLEEVTKANGKVIPISRGQIIQSLEGGIIKSIDVQEGDEVGAGQTLAIIDDTGFRAEYADLKGQTIALRASLSRLYAELNGDKVITFEPEVMQAKGIVQVEKDLFIARQRKMREGVASVAEKLQLSQKHLELVAPMVRSGATSKVEGIKVERDASDLKGQLYEVKNTYYQEINDQIAKQSSELASLNQRLAQKQDALSRTDLRSPVRGIVKNLSVTTRGGVVRPGETIMEIVPLDDQLYVEAEIKPRDVAFLHPGLPATVKITAYDYSIYGSLKGKLVYIAADTMKDETKREAEPYYRVRVLTDAAYLNGPEGHLPIKPGMVAEVDIQTGAKTVLDYLLKPILKGREALSER